MGNKPLISERYKSIVGYPAGDDITADIAAYDAVLLRIANTNDLSELEYSLADIRRDLPSVIDEQKREMKT
jgi:hypothetical protein